MSGYNGRRGPNVSQYVAKLNTIPSAQDTASRNQDPLEIENDLALFTNTEFFDFDLGEVHDLTQPVDYDPAMEERARRQNASAYNRHLNSNNTNTNNNGSKSVDFMDGMFACFLVSITSFIFHTSLSPLSCPYYSDLGIACGSACVCGPRQYGICCTTAFSALFNHSSIVFLRPFLLHI